MKWLLWKLGLVDYVWVVKCYTPKGSYLAAVLLDTETGERFIDHCGDYEKLAKDGSIVGHAPDRFKHVTYMGLFSRPIVGLVKLSGMRKYLPVKVYNELVEK